MIDKFELGEKVFTLKGTGYIDMIVPTNSGTQYSVHLSGDHGTYMFCEGQVFKYDYKNQGSNVS